MFYNIFLYFVKCFIIVNFVKFMKPDSCLNINTKKTQKRETLTLPFFYCI